MTQVGLQRVRCELKRCKRAQVHLGADVAQVGGVEPVRKLDDALVVELALSGLVAVSRILEGVSSHGDEQQ